MTGTESVAEYISRAKLLPPATKEVKPVTIAYLSSSTTKGMKEVLTVKCRGLGIAPTIYEGDYNQYAQEILNPASGLYSSNPNLVILFIDTRSLLGDLCFTFYEHKEREIGELFIQKVQLMHNLIDRMKRGLSAKLLIHNFEVPEDSPLGILDGKQPLGIIEFVQKINAELRDSYKSDPQVHVFDYDAFLSRYGKRAAFDYKLYYLADLKLASTHFPLLADRYLRYLKPLLSMSKKCLVLDLDNTLWGGVIGEDGLSGIRLGPTPEGRPYLEFQRYILSLFNRGVILAVNSKNNPDDALSVFREHPSMVLKESNFASMQINWNDKISNLRQISQELEIGLDTFVFVDDDKLNCEMVRRALPEVEVVQLPDDSSLYLQTIMDIDDFDTYQLTDEDRQKGKMYAEQKQRVDFSRATTDITEYLKGLAMTVTIERATTFLYPRISQLTQKTNQFNVTTRRYQEEDIARMSTDPNRVVVAIKVVDTFGDSGIIGVAIMVKASHAWTIDTLLMSCRVLGRRVEDALLAFIIKEAKKGHAAKLCGEFIPTKKNIPAKDFFREHGFTLVKTENERGLWEYDLKDEYPYPEFIKIIER